jgi:hypothetical protein
MSRVETAHIICPLAEYIFLSLVDVVLVRAFNLSVFGTRRSGKEEVSYDLDALDGLSAEFKIPKYGFPRFVNAHCQVALALAYRV